MLKNSCNWRFRQHYIEGKIRQKYTELKTVSNAQMSEERNTSWSATSKNERRVYLFETSPTICGHIKEGVRKQKLFETRTSATILSP